MKIIDYLNELKRNANIGKYRHFSAADRAKRTNDMFGLFVVLSNIMLGSVFFVLLTIELPTYAKWGGGILALSAALASGIQSFMNFSRLFESHRKLGNMYLFIHNDIQHTLSLYQDKIINENELAISCKEFVRKYEEIVKKASSFRTSNDDYEKALKNEKIKLKRLNDSKSMEG